MFPSVMTWPYAEHEGPRASRLLYMIGRVWVRVYGWKVEGQVPGRRAVLIAHPHTSNWDLPHMIAVSGVLGTWASWLGKDSLFRPPFGWFIKALGGIPVDRSAPRGQVGEAIARIQESDRILLVVPPSGTRSRRDSWRSGFYWIAVGAQVPIACGYLDYGRKRAGIGLAFVPTGDIKADMDRIRAFYEGMTGAYPEETTRIYLSAEDEPSASDGAASAADGAPEPVRSPETSA